MDPWILGSWTHILDENLSQRLLYELTFSDLAIVLCSAICHCNLHVIGHLLDTNNYDWDVSDEAFIIDLKNALLRIHERIANNDEIAIITYARIAERFNI